MKKEKFNTFTKTLLIPTLIIAGLSACGYEDGARTNMNNGTQANNVNLYNTNANGHDGDQADQITAARVENEAEKVAGVDQATVIVNGQDIVIGINGLTERNGAQLEKKVHQAIKSIEPRYNIHVTSDNNLHTRIRGVYDNLNTNQVNPGFPMRGYGNDVADIIRDMGRNVTAPFR